MNHLGLFCAVALGGVFLVSAWGKLGRTRLRVFAATAGPLSLLPRGWRGWAAAAVATAELGVVTALGAGAAFAASGLPPGRAVLLLGFLGVATLLVVFTVAIGLLVARGVRATCRCFGAHDTPLGPAHIVRNLILLAFAVTGALAPAGALTIPGAGLAAGCGALAAILVVRFDDLLALFRATAPRDAARGSR
ncbi:MAG TPA: MauE/DoxX family redox-associated membrane protein [Actinophytocola sp.]|uniref:MauE/DoxX family redox-associated membrane protein n=1 Tax=Actinophytocola sp. TaxID=1872138 RepID=UPI002DB75DB3|nr:MauE/DoxX family redox-associated membrane protein [Actinophytocola sp.]HEU5475342.1 MauE/DoxX family redox-associated membrane protein [Actinophytocola sp.]